MTPRAPWAGRSDSCTRRGRFVSIRFLFSATNVELSTKFKNCKLSFIWKNTQVKASVLQNVIIILF